MENKDLQSKEPAIAVIDLRLYFPKVKWTLHERLLINNITPHPTYNLEEYLNATSQDELLKYVVHDEEFLIQFIVTMHYIIILFTPCIRSAETGLCLHILKEEVEGYYINNDAINSTLLVERMDDIIKKLKDEIQKEKLRQEKKKKSLEKKNKFDK